MKINGIQYSEKSLLHHWVLVDWDDVGLKQALLIGLWAGDEKSKGKVTAKTEYRIYEPMEDYQRTISADQIKKVMGRFSVHE